LCGWDFHWLWWYCFAELLDLWLPTIVLAIRRGGESSPDKFPELITRYISRILVFSSVAFPTCGVSLDTKKSSVKSTFSAYR
jgi:hypothetical protein